MSFVSLFVPSFVCLSIHFSLPPPFPFVVVVGGDGGDDGGGGGGGGVGGKNVTLGCVGFSVFHSFLFLFFSAFVLFRSVLTILFTKNLKCCPRFLKV